MSRCQMMMVCTQESVVGVVEPFLGLATHIVGKIYGEQREYYHAGDREHDGHYLAGYCDRGYVASDCRHIHCCPPQCRPVGVDLRIDRLFLLEEYEAAEVCDQEHNGYVGHEQRRDGVARDVAYHDGEGERSAGKGDEPDEIECVGGQVDVEQADDVEVGDAQQEKCYAVACELPLVCRIVHLDKEVNDEHDAHPELEVHIGGVFEKVYLLECVDGNEYDEKD